MLPFTLGLFVLYACANYYSISLINYTNDEIDSLLSKEEANAIRRGVGASGADNTARQAEILARMAPTLQSAAQKSYADALSEVSAENKIKTDRFNLLRQALADRLSNETLAGTTGLNLDTRLRQATSGVYDRDVGSAFNSGFVL